MSSGRRGRGRGRANPLAAPFNPHPSTQSSPQDTRMEESPASPVQTVATYTFSSDSEEEPATLESHQESITTLEECDTQLLHMINNLNETLQALEKHLMVVQERHIQDTKDLHTQISTLTARIQHLVGRPQATTSASAS